jgi:RNA polymerase-interacting CarD/CdnL/TRCF family regulator
MFGLKKTIPINEFGLGVLRYADEFISADAGRSLGTQFENWDTSSGWWNFLHGRGIPIPTLKLYQRLYTHCVLQTVFKGFSVVHRWEMVHGAITGIIDCPENYDLNKTFAELEAVFGGEYKLAPAIHSLSSDARLPFMAYPNVGILASKYLVEKFVIPNLANSKNFLDNFQSYSGTFGSSVATANRAMNQITDKFKIGPQLKPPTVPERWKPPRINEEPVDESVKPKPIVGPISPFAWARNSRAPASKPVDLKRDWDGFEINDAIYYRAIGMGRIVGVEEFEGIEGVIQRFVIEFEEDEAVLRVPVSKLREMSSRKPLVLAEEEKFDDLDEEDDLPILESNGFKVGEHVVYPQHGVGKIVAIERQEIAGAKIEMFVINFKNDSMTLRVPTEKYKNVGMRRLADEI